MRLQEVDVDWYFKDSEVLEYRDTLQGEFLKFKQKNSSVNAMYFITYGGYLFVFGDLGEATYQWAEKITLEWVSGLSIDYFHEKCQASELGRSYLNYEWNEVEAEKSVLDHFKYMFEDYEGEEFEDKMNSKIAEFKDSGGFYALESKEEWAHWVNEYGYDVFDDGDLWEWAYGVGNVISGRTQLHLYGLKEAFKFIKEHGIEKEKCCGSIEN